MNASSQNPPGALPPERTPARSLPKPVPLSEAARAAFASYGAVLPAPAGPVVQVQREPQTTPVRAAAGVIEAAMTGGAATAREIAQAEADAGLLFDPKRAEDIASAAAEQAHAEDMVELAERGRQLAAMAGAKRQLDAVCRLLEGRPGTDLLTVAEIAAAAEYARTPFDAFPMTLAWTGEVEIPGPGDTEPRAIVKCRSAYGQDAHLVLDEDARFRLASLVDLHVRDIHAPCPHHAGCGAETDYDMTDPQFFGWSRLEVAGIEGGPRWYCSDMCVIDALARAGHDLAADDQANVGGDL